STATFRSDSLVDNLKQAAYSSPSTTAPVVPSTEECTMRDRFDPRRLATLMVALTMAATPRAWAQSTATLQGTVTDAQNAVIPGVAITTHNPATNQERAVVTDAAGQYVAASLAPGHFEVTAHIEGFQDQKREIDLGPAQTMALNLKLNVGTLAENVTV